MIDDCGLESPGENLGTMMSVRKRAEHFGDALILLAQSDDRRDRQAAAHQLLADFVRPYLPQAKRHDDALSRLDRMIKAEAEARPELLFLAYVRKLITVHRPSNVRWVCQGDPPPECTLTYAPEMPIRNVEDVRSPSRVLGCS
jgi:hypothetical protein